jgi:hypothetical protein
MFKKMLLVGLCILGISTAHGMSHAVWKGFVWGASIPTVVGIPYVVMQNSGTASEKLLPAFLAVGAGGVLGGIGGGLSYVLSSAALNANNKPLAGDLCKILYRAKMSGLATGMTAGFAFVSFWVLQTIYPSGGFFNP